MVLVAVDVDPGLYATYVPGESAGCYWERLADLDARFATVLASGSMPPGARVVVEIAESDEGFNSIGCGPWEPYAAPPRPAESFFDGNWIVGADIVPGSYRSSGPSEDDGCAWERQLGFSGQFYDILESGTTSEHSEVTIEPGDYSFMTRGCGAWELIN